jgi:hypothetical protein
VREEGGDLHGAQLARMPSSAELDEAAHLGDAGPLGFQAIVAKADLLANGGKERARRAGRGGGMSQLFHIATRRVSRGGGRVIKEMPALGPDIWLECRDMEEMRQI